jgi:uncharacterized protein YegL
MTTEEVMAMTNPEFDPQMADFADNPEPRCPCLLLLDTSGSMAGKAIEQLNAGLMAFRDTLKQDRLASLRVEIAVISFGSKASLVHDFVTADQFNPAPLNAGGSTPMGSAIQIALDLLEQRKELYKKAGTAYYRPWAFLITDGEPTDEWQSAAQRVQSLESKKGVAFFAVAVEKADMAKLAQIAPKERPPKSLIGLDFTSLFLWLSKSLTNVSHSKVGEQVPLAPVDGWTSI